MPRSGADSLHRHDPLQFQPREDLPRVTLVDCLSLCIAEPGVVVDITSRIIEKMSGFRIDAPHRADHFGGEQNVFCWNYIEQQIDAGLVVDAGVEIHVVQQQISFVIGDEFAVSDRDPAYGRLYCHGNRRGFCAPNLPG